jgi:hypothetical protein
MTAYESYSEMLEAIELAEEIFNFVKEKTQK